MELDSRNVETVLLATSLLLLLALAGAVALSAPVGAPTPAALALVDDDGRAADYPTSLAVGERGETVVEVTNHAAEERTYTVVVTYEGRSVTVDTVTVSADSRHRIPVSFTADGPPGRKRLAVALWTGESSVGEPDLTARVWVTVSEETDTGGDEPLDPRTGPHDRREPVPLARAGP